MTDLASEAASGDVIVIDIQELFDRYIDGKQKVWKHDRMTTAGASEVFSCIRKQVFDKRGAEFGAEPDDDYDEDWGAMERGNILEDHFLVPALQTQLPSIGLELLYAGQVNQETLVSGRNSATPDGLITGLKPSKYVLKTRTKVIEFEIGEEGCIGLEFKSIDPRANLVEERAKHHYQSQMGIGLINELTDWKPKHWIILYVDASFVSKLTPFLVSFEPEIFRIGKIRAQQIWEFEAPHEAAPEGKFDGGCDHCKWRKACGDATLSLWKQLDDKDDDEYTAAALQPAVMAYLAAKKDSEKAAQEFEEAKQALKDAMQQHGARRVVSDVFRINWTTVKGKKYLDQKALRESGLVDLDAFMKTGAGHDQLTVTLRKEE